MRTKVLIKHTDDVHWEDPELGAYPDESKLKTILRDDPTLLPFDEPRRPLVMVDEFPVSIGDSYGFIDLVGVSRTGALTIVECKLEKNPDIKRRLVGQLVEYAAALWRVPYDAFDALWQAVKRPGMMTDDQWEERKRPPLEEDIAAAVGDDAAFEPGTFRAAVEGNLLAGRFTLVVAVDSITDALQQSILYLSEHTGPDVRVVALELGYVAHGDVEVLIPRAFGLEAAERQPPVPTPRSSRAWDEASFDASLRELKGDTPLHVERSLREWARGPEVGLEVWYGHGASYGTESFGLVGPDGTRHSLFSLYTSATVQLDLGNIRYFPAYAEAAPRLDVLHALAPIEGRTRKDEQVGGWPQFGTEVFVDPAKLAAFKALVTEIAVRIRQA